ncbi:MAG: hypothetical protein KGI50_02790 [Patescibacteria group bacterium]|nr:hypothetical protein [Patescibacteria group bacterium]MDE2438564.1 hypothetical protein [Patescibacteria group bacterium]
MKGCVHAFEWCRIAMPYGWNAQLLRCVHCRQFLAGIELFMQDGFWDKNCQEVVDERERERVREWFSCVTFNPGHLSHEERVRGPVSYERLGFVEVSREEFVKIGESFGLRMRLRDARS